MKNRFLLIVLAIIILVLVIGCSSDKEEDVQKTTEVSSSKKSVGLPTDLTIPAKPANFTSKVATSEEAYAVFAEFMDLTIGKDAWKQGEYSYNEKDALLTVKNFSVTAEDNALEVTSLTAEEIYLRSSLNKEGLVEVFNLMEWKNKPATEIFNFYGFKNLKITKDLTKINGMDSENLDEDVDKTTENLKSNFNIKVEKLYVTSLNLKEVGDINSTNSFFAFLNIFKLGNSEALNTTVDYIVEGDKHLSFSVAYDEVSNLEFNVDNEEFNKVLTERNITLPAELKTLLAGSADSRTVMGLNVTTTFVNKDVASNVDYTFKIDSFEFKGMDSALKGALFSLNNLYFSAIAPADGYDFEDETFSNLAISLESLDVKNYNAINMLNLFSDYQNVNSFMEMGNGITGKSLADMLFGDMAIETMNGKNFNFTFDTLKMNLAEFNQTGPKMASTPSDIVANIKDFIIELPTEKDGLKADKNNDLYQFGQDFGMTKFVINSNYNAKYDAAKGSYVINLEKAKVEDLLNVSMVMSFAGLNEKNIASLKKYNIENLVTILDAESETAKLKELEDFSLTGVSYKIEDLGIMDKVYNLISIKEHGGAMTKEDVRNMAVMGLSFMGTSAGEYIENPNELVATLKTFLEEKKSDGSASLEARINIKELKAGEAVKVLDTYDYIGLLNDLKISVIGNDKKSTEIKFLSVAS